MVERGFSTRIKGSELTAGEEVVDFTDKHRNILKNMVREAHESKIMITHSMTGDRSFDNDDMRETVFFLGRRFFKKKTIVITKTITAEYKDSPFNLGLSLGVLSKNKEGTFQVFNKESVSWQKVEIKECAMVKSKDILEEFVYRCELCKEQGKESARYPTKKLLTMHINHQHYGVMTSD